MLTLDHYGNLLELELIWCDDLFSTNHHSRNTYILWCVRALSSDRTVARTMEYTFPRHSPSRHKAKLTMPEKKLKKKHSSSQDDDLQLPDAVIPEGKDSGSDLANSGKNDVKESALDIKDGSEVS